MIPKTVRIGAFDVEVRFVKNLMTDDEVCGDYNDRIKLIRLDPDTSPAMQQGVFYHEVVEAIKDIYDIRVMREDHHIINLMGEALHQILRDNMEAMLPLP